MHTGSCQVQCFKCCNLSLRGTLTRQTWHTAPGQAQHANKQMSHSTPSKSQIWMKQIIAATARQTANHETGSCSTCLPGSSLEADSEDGARTGSPECGQRDCIHHGGQALIADVHIALRFVIADECCPLGRAESAVLIVVLLCKAYHTL